jgi:anti-sigma factor RsiW
MNCDEAELLLHSVADNEIDAQEARRIESHVGACAGCAAQLRLHRDMRKIMLNADLRFRAPSGLRARIIAMLPMAAAAAPYRRTLFKGFAFGSALSAAAAALLTLAVTRSDQDQVVVSDVVSAHLRSLQANHLTDVQTSDQPGVSPGLAAGSGLRHPSPT